jgi:hypothetical protein
VRRKESIEKRVGVFGGEVAVEDDVEAEVEAMRASLPLISYSKP